MEQSYEIMLFGDSPAPVFRAYRNTEAEAIDFAEKELRAGRGRCYNGAIWNKHPNVFFVLYINNEGEIFITHDPVIFTREQAANLRRRPIGETADGRR